MLLVVVVVVVVLVVVGVSLMPFEFWLGFLDPTAAAHSDRASATDVSSSCRL